MAVHDAIVIPLSRFPGLFPLSFLLNAFYAKILAAGPSPHFFYGDVGVFSLLRDQDPLSNLPFMRLLKL